MKKLNDAPSSLQQTKLYLSLSRRGFPATALLALVDDFVGRVGPLLNSIGSGPFKDYTLHDVGHAKKVVHLIGEAISDTSLTRLSALEETVLILSAFLHDLGMSLSYRGREKYLESPAFQKELNGLAATKKRIGNLQAKLAEPRLSDAERSGLIAELFQVQEVALSSILRRTHATEERYLEVLGEVLAGQPIDKYFAFKGVPFADYLLRICISHGLPAQALLAKDAYYGDQYPTDLIIAGETLNTQFCAAALRLADILDFDYERTPLSLFASLGLTSKEIPGAEVSLFEWNKHKAVHSLTVTSTELAIHADCYHPAIEQGVRLFARDIESEITATLGVLHRAPAAIAEKYELVLPLVVLPRIRSHGYVFKELAFRLNEAAIMRLLMGANLYPSPAAAVRELIQNAIDACRVRQRVEAGYNRPSVSIRRVVSGEQVFIEVEDNGIGMNEHVLQNYFFQIGATYYDSADFRALLGEKALDFAPISRFGIGIMSVFMIADRLELETCNPNSANGDRKYRSIEISSVEGLAVIREKNSGRSGTKIRMRLLPKVQRFGIIR